MQPLEVFVLGYGVAMLAGAKALRQRGLKGWWFTIATMPLYWLLMSSRRLDGPVAVHFRTLQLEQDRTRIVEASGLVAAAARTGRGLAHQGKQKMMPKNSTVSSRNTSAIAIVMA